MNKTVYRIAIGAGLALAAAGVYWYSAPGADRAAEHAALLQQGIELFEQEQYAEALQRLQEIPAGAADDWRVHYYIGSAHMMLQDYRQAVAALERALEVNSRETGVMYALGVSHYKLGQLDLAKAYFAAVLEISPNDQHARGLMDIMAKLEQQSAAAPPEAPPQADD